MNGPPRNAKARMAAGSSAKTKTTNLDSTAINRARHTVVAIKSSGAQVVFGCYSNRLDAERVVQQLLKVSCFARIEPARRGDQPGRQRRTR